jgi:hypothetical protein
VQVSEVPSVSLCYSLNLVASAAARLYMIEGVPCAGVQGSWTSKVSKGHVIIHINL